LAIRVSSSYGSAAGRLIPSIVACLDDKDSDVREAAILALEQLHGGDLDIDAILTRTMVERHALEDDDEYFGEEIAFALDALGARGKRAQASVPAITKILEKELGPVDGKWIDEDIVAASFRALGDIGIADDAARRTLELFLKNHLEGNKYELYNSDSLTHALSALPVLKL
jgi:hypothetical protein